MDKGQSVPVELRTRIKRIVDKNEKTLRYYHELRRNDTILMPRDYVIISNLFVYSLYWTYRLNKFYYEKQNSYSLKELEQIYKDWKTYSKNVDEVDMWSPNPGNSDMCLVTVAINPKNIGTKTISWCPIANICYKMLNEGTNFGYALCHRIIMLIMAQLGQGCALSSVQEDKQMMQKFCSMAYAEAEYIAMNDYGIPDLMLEIMCLCSMDGRVQFLRRSWLHKMFEFQTSTGCFGLVESNDEESHFYVCNSHTTSLASGTYAAAVRFILEEFY